MNRFYLEEYSMSAILVNIKIERRTRHLLPLVVKQFEL